MLYIIFKLKEKKKFSKTMIMQDGAPPHTANQTKALLICEFGNWVISRGLDFAWP
jgi:hypothetical protein